MFIYIYIYLSYFSAFISEKLLKKEIINQSVCKCIDRWTLCTDECWFLRTDYSLRLLLWYENLYSFIYAVLKTVGRLLEHNHIYLISVWEAKPWWCDCGVVFYNQPKFVKEDLDVAKCQIMVSISHSQNMFPGSIYQKL